MSFIFWVKSIGKIVNYHKTQNNRVEFIDFSGLFIDKTSYEQLCIHREPSNCPFYDVTHYKPHVGDLIMHSFKS